MNRHGHDLSLAIGKMQQHVDTLARPRLPSGSRVAIRRSAIAMRAAMNEIYYDINPGAGDWKRLETLVDTILAETKAPENVRIVRPTEMPMPVQYFAREGGAVDVVYEVDFAAGTWRVVGADDDEPNSAGKIILFP